MPTRTYHTRTQATAAIPLATADPNGEALETARLHDRARQERVAARFQRPVNWMGACHRASAALAGGSLSMTARMLTAFIFVLLVSLYVVNSPLDTTYGLQQPPPRALDCLGLPINDAPQASAPIPVGLSYLDDLPPPLERHPEPRAVDVLQNTPALLATIFGALTALFAAAAVLSLLLRETSALGLRLLLRWAHRLGVDVPVPRS